METEEPDKRGGSEWQTKQTSKRNKPKNQSSIGTTSTLTSIMRTGSNYSDSRRRRRRGRGGRSATNQRQVQTNEKPAEHRINTTYLKQPQGVVKQEEVHLFTLKACPGVMEAKGHNIQQIIQVVIRTIDRKTGFTAVFHLTTKGKSTKVNCKHL